MKKIIIGVLVILAAIAGAYVFYKKGAMKDISKEPSNEPIPSTETEWKYEKTIQVPIKKMGGADQDVVLGDIDRDAISVNIPKGSFDSETEIELGNPDSVPKYLGNEIDTIGAPIDISVGKPVRLNEKVDVTFKFDKGKLPEGTTKSELRVMYYDGSQWEYIKPSEVDFEKGLIRFETYHFSLFGLNKIKDETKITEEFVRSAALDKVMKDKFNDASDQVAGQIISMTLEKMGITDDSIKGKVLTELLTEDGYKELHDSLKSGDPEAGQKLAVLAGSKIAQVVPESVFSEALSNVSGNAEVVANVSKAAGYAAGGQYKDAAKVIGEQIADEFLITTAGKIAVEVVQGQIDSWKNSEVEAAYKAYKNGADGKFWGYNVEKDDFNGVWTQMRGIGRQLEIEAIAKENAVREESGMPPLTEKQEARVRDAVKESLRKQFEVRSKNEDAIQKAEQDLKIVMDAFKKADFFSDALGPQGLDKGLDYENKLGVLGHFADKIMKDTNRPNVSTKSGLIMDTAISVDDIVQGARIYFSVPDGKKKYQEFIKERFGIDPFPKLSELKGSWKGTTVITDIIISEAAKKELESAKDSGGEGCDLGKLEEAKGKANPLNFTLEPTSETGGNFTSNGKTTPFTYTDGVLSMTMAQDDTKGSMNLTVSKDANAYVASGSMTADYKNGMLKIIMSANASKGK